MKLPCTVFTALLIVGLVVVSGCGGRSTEDEELRAIANNDAPPVWSRQADWKGAVDSVEHMLRTQDLNPDQEKALRKLLFDLKSSAAEASRGKH